MELCTGDPLLDLVFKKYRAHPISVPEAWIRPLTIFFRESGDHFSRIGPLADVVTPETRARLHELEPDGGPMADLTAAKSGSVDTKLGLTLLGGFLSAFGAGNCMPAVEAQFSRVRKVSFGFQDVVREGYSVSSISRLLPTQPFDKSQVVVDTWIAKSKTPTCYLVDSVIRASNFTVTVAAADRVSAEVSHVPVQAALDATARVAVSSQSASDLHFKGKERLPFALTCLRVTLKEEAGKIAVEPYNDKVSFLRPDETGEMKHALLSDVPILMEWNQPKV